MKGADLLLELGSEELPAGFIQPGVERLAALLLEALDNARLGHGPAALFSTPRRLAVRLSDVAERQADLDQQVVGPPVKAAFTPAGEPTPAALGFAKVNGVAVHALARVATPKGEYLAAQVHEIGKPARELLPGLLTAAIRALTFPKTMRWGSLDDTWPRPLLWILALHGEATVPLSYAGIDSAGFSRGHRFLHPDPFRVPAPGEYETALRDRLVEVDSAKRQEAVKRSLDGAAHQAGSRINVESGVSLLGQVTNLVEWPWVVLGSFDPANLELPREVLLSELTVHQRYFGLDRDGALSPQFAVVSGTGLKDPAVSRHGYERVLRARLADARFFWEEDRKRTLESRVESLGAIVFQQKLGTVLEKSQRAAALAERLGKHLDLDLPTLARAARLAKADLVTGMVGEFPELQGIMGGYYATHDRESVGVVAAVRDQYLPKFAGDRVPETDEGAALGLADRFDTLAGLFAIGRVPTGSADPFALRRACLAIVSIVEGRALSFSLRDTLVAALEGVAAKASAPQADTLDKLLAFFRARLKAMWSEDQRPDVVEAVLAVGFDDIYLARLRLGAIGALVGRPEFVPLAVAFKRTAAILEKFSDAETEVRPELLRAPAERRLFEEREVVFAAAAKLLEARNYAAALQEMAKLRGAIDAFFDQVLVMVDDRALRENRLRLLASLRTFFNQVADLSQIQAEAK